MARTEAVNPNTRGVNTSAFDSEDLSFLQEIVDELLAGLVETEGYRGQGDSRESLRGELAKVILAIAQPGERDVVSLKLRVMRSRFGAGGKSAGF
jgi:hypothetical protein